MITIVESNKSNAMNASLEQIFLNWDLLLHLVLIFFMMEYHSGGKVPALCGDGCTSMDTASPTLCDDQKFTESSDARMALVAELQSWHCTEVARAP